MENEDWQEIVTALVNAKRQLREAWSLLDGTDGAADGVAQAFSAATSSIDAIYAVESTNAFNADVAAPTGVQEFWDAHGALPGFAIGT